MTQTDLSIYVNPNYLFICIIYACYILASFLKDIIIYVYIVVGYFGLSKTGK